MYHRKPNNRPIDCRHKPVGKSTHMIDRFRYWFVFFEGKNGKYPYAVGMVKCAKCRKVICVPNLYYSIPINLLYMLCCAFLTWSGMKLLIGSELQKLTALICVLLANILAYFLVDRIFWAAVMQFGRWKAKEVGPEEKEIFILNESKLFSEDRVIKRGMWLLGGGVAYCALGKPHQWYVSYLCGVLIGLLIFSVIRTIKRIRNARQ